MVVVLYNACAVLVFNNCYTWNTHFVYIQQFWERLCYRSIKATMLKGTVIMGSGTLPFFDWSSRYFSLKEGEPWIQVFRIFPSILLQSIIHELRSTSSKLTLHSMPFGLAVHCMWFYTFVGPPFLKQLYIIIKSV